MNFFVQIEQSGLGVWVRESFWGFPITLIVHSIALAFVAGVNFAIALRLLGAAARIPLSVLYRLLPLMWICFFLCLVSGLLLLAAYPAKALTNGVFYLKLSLVAVGLTFAQKVTRHYQHGGGVDVIKGRWQGIALLAIWAGAIISGRLLAYTFNIMMASDYYL